MHSNDN